MPRCEGDPEGACPGKVNNHTVKLTQGDLMLCKECDEYRFPPAPSSRLLPADSAATLQSAFVPQAIGSVDTQIAQDESNSCTDQRTMPVSSRAQEASTGASKSCLPNEPNLVQCELLYFVLGCYGQYPEATIKSTVLVLHSVTSKIISTSSLTRSLLITY